MKKTIKTIIIIAILIIAETGAKAMDSSNLANLKHTMNEPYGDYFVGDEKFLTKLVGDFYQDPSHIDSIYMYMGANTAYHLGKVREAGFLFYTAQIRKKFDIERFGLGVADGNNIRTYMDFINHTSGIYINPMIISSPEDFSAVIDRIEMFEVIPQGYKHIDYGQYVIPENEWPELAHEIKEGFLNDFGRRYKALLGDPVYAKSMKFVQLYNFNEIEKTEENTKLFNESLEYMKEAESKY